MRLLALLAISPLLFAETNLKFGGFSQHLSEGNYNSFHRVAIVSHNSYFGGYFRNSFNDDSFTVGRTWSSKGKYATYQLHGGLVYGYRHCRKLNGAEGSKNVCAMIAPEVMAHRLQFKPSIALVGLDAAVLTFNYGL